MSIAIDFDLDAKFLSHVFCDASSDVIMWLYFVVGLFMMILVPSYIFTNIEGGVTLIVLSSIDT